MQWSRDRLLVARPAVYTWTISRLASSLIDTRYAIALLRRYKDLVLKTILK